MASEKIFNLASGLYKKKDYMGVMVMYNKTNQFAGVTDRYKYRLILILTYCYNELRFYGTSVDVLDNLYKTTKSQIILLELLKLYMITDKLPEYEEKRKEIKVTDSNMSVLKVLDIVFSLRTNDYKKQGSHSDIYNTIYAQWQKEFLPGIFILDRLTIDITNKQLYELTKLDGNAHLMVPSSIKKIQSIKNLPKYNIGFISPDFFERPSGFLMKHLFKYFKSDKYRTVLFSRLNKQKGELASYLKQFCDKSVELEYLSTETCAEAIRSESIHILIDIMGLMPNNNLAILSLKPAPIQIAWLAYPGTLGMDCIDYFVADSHIIPSKERKHYSEKIIYMPECYQINDDMIYADPSVELFSPEIIGMKKGWDDKFILGSMNYSYKIDKVTWEMWKTIMNKTSNTLLVILTANKIAAKNLIVDWVDSGLAADRLILWQPIDVKLQYYRIKKFINLGLDPHFCNSHTTGADILINGVPLVTWPANTFAGSVGSSLLYNIDMGELVAKSSSEYIDLVVKLAENKEYYTQIKDKLAYSIRKHNLFNTKRYVGHLVKGLDMVVDNINSDQITHIIIPPNPEYVAHPVNFVEPCTIKFTFANTENNIKILCVSNGKKKKTLLEIILSKVPKQIFINKKLFSIEFPELSNVNSMDITPETIRINNTVIKLEETLSNLFNVHSIDSNVQITF